MSVESAAAPTAPGDAATGRHVGTSVIWSALNAGVLRAASFLVSLIVAHLVAPFDFGIYTVAFTVLMFALSMPELGVSSALVREHDRSREIAPTVFTLSLAAGGALAVVMALAAPFLARELGAPQATSAIRVLALIPFLSGFSAVPVALMSRDYMQRQRFITDSAFFVVSTVTMLPLVLTGHAVMGLVWSQVAGHVVANTMLIRMAPERYWPGFRRAEARRLLAFGLPLAGANLLTVAIANVDFVVVGHWLGAQKLGYYNLAFNISGWPISIFGAVLVSVTLPTLARVRNDPAELTRHLRAGVSAIAAVAFPVFALLAALAGPLIDTVYGRRWHEAWSALVVLAVFGAARTVLNLFSDLAIALGITRRLLLIQLTWIGALVPAMIICVTRWGIIGAGVAHAVVVVFVVLPLYVHTIRRRTPVSVRAVQRPITRPLALAVVVGLAAYAASLLPGLEVWQLLLGIAVGVVVYAALGGRWLVATARMLRDMYWRHAPAAEPAHG